MIAWLAVGLAFAWPLQGPDGVVAEIAAEAVLQEGEVPIGAVGTDPQRLGAVAAATSAYLAAQGPFDKAVGPGLAGELGVTLGDVQATLDFVARVAEEDRGKPVQRLQDPRWIAEHFRVLTWTPHDARQRPQPALRLTKYLVPQTDGRAAPEGVFDTALYGVPSDEAGLDEAAAALAKGLDRFAYTRQEVLGGVYGAGGAAAGRAPALVWLRRSDVLDAMMQGTVEVTVPGGMPRTFNVARNNGRPYVKGRSGEQQERFWYFREVEGVIGWGWKPDAKIPVEPGVTVAGDVWNLGLGKLIALSWDTSAGPQTRLVVLADTGGAFHPNLGQLDLLAGAFPSHEAMYAATSDVPDYVRPAILILRR